MVVFATSHYCYTQTVKMCWTLRNNLRRGQKVLSLSSLGPPSVYATGTGTSFTAKEKLTSDVRLL